MPEKCLFIFVMLLASAKAIRPGNFTCHQRLSQCTGVRRPNCFESSTELRFACSLRYQHCRNEWLRHCTPPLLVACWDYNTHCDCLCYLALRGNPKRRGQNRRL
uniref:Secreted protein n=1 Tax=Rhipicephalus appendiculatus TaxID=34631 RepID=A0A131Z559_RHIAP